MRILKIITFIVLGLCILAIIVVFGGWLYYSNKYPVDEDKYPNYIGYINQETAELNKVIELCDAESIYHVHHGASEKGYAINKKQFRDVMLASYKNENYTDSGYLNFRFLVTCEGKAGWFETIQVDSNYKNTQFSKELVSQLQAITAKSENWKIISFDDKPVDYYMYVSYKLKDGEITEILP